MDELEIWIASAQQALSRGEHIDARDVLAYMVRLAELVQERTRPPQ